MPIIIDTNCFSNVFSRNSAKHNEFKPVLEWLISGNGMIVYGGQKYKGELKKASKFLKIFRLFKESGKVLIGNDFDIDILQQEIDKKNNVPEFNDTHLLAISISTKCQIICSEDTTSIKFVTDKKYSPKGFRVPVYYTSFQNKNLLCDKYVHKSLKPLSKMPKKIQTSLLKQI